MTQIVERHLFERNTPILPAVGDIRIIVEIKENKKKTPYFKFHIAKCVEMKRGTAIYEWIGENFKEIVPYEVIETYGYQSVDAAIMSEFNKFLQRNLIDSSKNLDEYYQILQDAVLLARQALKEASKTRTEIVNAFQKPVVWAPGNNA